MNSSSLFDSEPEQQSGAVISDCGKYRYHLWRIWNSELPVMVWVMLNPSTADATQDDPTIRRCIGFAKREGCGGISVRNIFALRATNPKDLLKHPDPVGPENESHLLSARNSFLMSVLVVGWGCTIPSLRGRYTTPIACLLPQSPQCFGVTKNGDPKHPLYLPKNAPLVEWRK